MSRIAALIPLLLLMTGAEAAQIAGPHPSDYGYSQYARLSNYNASLFTVAPENMSRPDFPSAAGSDSTPQTGFADDLLSNNEADDSVTPFDPALQPDAIQTPSADGSFFSLAPNSTASAFFVTLVPPTFASVVASPVPEPLTVVLFGAGLAGLGVLRRRRKQA